MISNLSQMVGKSKVPKMIQKTSIRKKVIGDCRSTPDFPVVGEKDFR